MDSKVERSMEAFTIEPLSVLRRTDSSPIGALDGLFFGKSDQREHPEHL